MKRTICQNDFALFTSNAQANSLVSSILGLAMVVNSSHHQAVDKPGSLIITGWAEDETIEVLENLCEVTSLKDEELDVIAELISNMYGALEVNQSIKSGVDKKTALNDFMKRVVGSIDK